MFEVKYFQNDLLINLYDDHKLSDMSKDVEFLYHHSFKETYLLKKQ